MYVLCIRSGLLRFGTDHEAAENSEYREEYILVLEIMSTRDFFF